MSCGYKSVHCNPRTPFDLLRICGFPPNFVAIQLVSTVDKILTDVAEFLVKCHGLFIAFVFVSWAFQ